MGNEKNLTDVSSTAVTQKLPAGPPVESELPGKSSSVSWASDDPELRIKLTSPHGVMVPFGVTVSAHNASPGESIAMNLMQTDGRPPFFSARKDVQADRTGTACVDFVVRLDGPAQAILLATAEGTVTLDFRSTSADVEIL